MGIDIDRSDFTADDYAAFNERVEANLASLKEVLARPDFGRGPGSVGAELEMYIVDESGNPLPKNQEILGDCDDPQLTLELNRYNLEYNLTPCPIDASPFEAIESEITTQLEVVGGLAKRHGGRIVPIGILPTLRDQDFGTHQVTDRARYHALVNQLIQRRGSKFEIHIDGEEPIRLEMKDVTLEGANTSFQLHYRVPPSEFADLFNAFQLVTPLALAVAANSPTLFGHRLWQETRIPLFKQSIDTRIAHRYSWREPARVAFGHGWCPADPASLFTEVVRLYEPLLPICDRAGAESEVPKLAELRLLQGTVWLWNRPVYDDNDGGMLRIEARALPAGPTPIDMVANAAFLIGLAEGIKPTIADLLPGLPFAMAEYNFYRAAQHGLDARLVWPEPRQYGTTETRITVLLERMLPVAAEGLARIGISDGASARYLGIIEERIRNARNGARWQLDFLAALPKSLSPPDQRKRLLEAYIARSRTGEPVARWTID